MRVRSAAKIESRYTCDLHESARSAIESQRCLQICTNVGNYSFVWGGYEGIDQRALDIIDAQECSIGDYVLSGGELAAMVLIDAVRAPDSGCFGE